MTELLLASDPDIERVRAVLTAPVPLEALPGEFNDVPLESGLKSLFIETDALFLAQFDRAADAAGIDVSGRQVAAGGLNGMLRRAAGVGRMPQPEKPLTMQTYLCDPITANLTIVTHDGIVKRTPATVTVEDKSVTAGDTRHRRFGTRQTIELDNAERSLTRTTINPYRSLPVESELPRHGANLAELAALVARSVVVPPEAVQAVQVYGRNYTPSEVLETVAQRMSGHKKRSR